MKKKVIYGSIAVILLVVVMMILLLSNAFLKTNEVELFISGGDFSNIMESENNQLEFRHGIKISENNEMINATYKLKISGENNVTIVAKGELEESIFQDEKIFMGTLEGELRISGKKYVTYVNIDKEIDGEKLFASITLQEVNGPSHAFLSVGEPIIFVE